MANLCRFVSGFQKCHLFLCTTIRNAKNAFQKCDVITFTWFFGHCTAKNKDIALKFCMLVVCMYLYHMYSVFFNKLKISDFISNYSFKESEI